MTNDDQIIAWKTSAWQDTGTARVYARRLAEPSGPDFMKGRREIALVRKYATGHDFLDVGAGTGRIARALAGDGRAVTALDNSRAMLAICRGMEPPVPLTSVEGDLFALPFEPRSFDTVAAIDTLIHFPNWQHAVAGWQRVVRPGGRIIFDAGSLDHDIAFARSTGNDEPYARAQFASQTVIGYTLRLKIDDVIAFANERELRVRAAIPYGILAGSGAPNHFFKGTPLAGHAWDRLISWAAEDRQLFDFFVFLEEQLFAALASAASSRLLIVLENEPDPQSNADFGNNEHRVASLLQGGLSKASLSAIGVDVPALRAGLAHHFTYAPNRYAFYRLLLANLKWNWNIEVRDFVPDAMLGETFAILGRGMIDRDLAAVVTGLHEQAEVRDDFTYQGVNLGVPWEADEMANLLTDCTNAFASSLEHPAGAHG